MDAGTIRSAFGLAPARTSGVSTSDPIEGAVGAFVELDVLEGSVSGSVCRRLAARPIVPISRDHPDASNGPVGS